jgi:hypothetical protein
MMATLSENVSILADKLNLLSGASPSGQPAQGGQVAASSAVPTKGKSMGVSAAAGRRLKGAMRETMLRTPLQTYRGVYARQSGGISYSPHADGKITDYVREIQAQDEALFGGTSVDIILAKDFGDDKVPVVWNRWYANIRSKCNESILAIWRKQNMCTRYLGIRASETEESAMVERVIEVSIMVSGLGTIVELPPLHLPSSRDRR